MGPAVPAEHHLCVPLDQPLIVLAGTLHSVPLSSIEAVQRSKCVALPFHGILDGHDRSIRLFAFLVSLLSGLLLSLLPIGFVLASDKLIGMAA